jgi:hypothetical protein
VNWKNKLARCFKNFCLCLLNLVHRFLGIFTIYLRHRHLGLLYLGKAKKLRDRFRGGHKACTWSWLDDYDNRDVAIAFARLTMLDVLKLGDELEGILIHSTQPPYNARYPSRG